MCKFCTGFETFSYLIMAAIEREERGGAMAYRGVKQILNWEWEHCRGMRIFVILHSGYPHKR